MTTSGPYNSVSSLHEALERVFPHVVDMRKHAVQQIDSPRNYWLEMNQWCEAQNGPSAKIRIEERWHLDHTRTWGRYGYRFYFAEMPQAFEFKIRWY